MKPYMKIDGKDYEINMEKLKLLSCTFIPKEYRWGVMLFAQKVTALMTGLEMENIDFEDMTPEEYVFAACLACAADYHDISNSDFLTMDDPDFLDYCGTLLCDKDRLLALHITDIVEAWCKKNGEFFSTSLFFSTSSYEENIEDVISIAGMPYTLDYSAVYNESVPQIRFMPDLPGFSNLICEIKDENSMDILYEEVYEELEEKENASEYEFN